MPRPWVETVEDFPAIEADRLYRIRIVDVEKTQTPPSISVSVEHIDAEQAGRQHVLVLPRPVRPTGLTAAFFAACGFAVTRQIELRPKETVGRVITVRFETAGGQAVAFQPEDSNERNEHARSAAAPAPAPAKAPDS